METDDLLNSVTLFADRAHGSQLRKYTFDRYIVHPIRVMEMLRPFTDDHSVFAAALLHDVLEDTDISKLQMASFLKSVMDVKTADRTLGLVIELTDVYTSEKYPQWNRPKRKAMEVERAGKTSALAQTIKYADIIDNCREIVEHDRNFAGIFLYECRNLLNAINKGDAALYEKAVNDVENAIARLKSS